ncbi:hypothetical protein CTH_0293 [Carboxydocella thermautotrophica]|nr:hypothetical protein CTH_0293 [Carboxydocella thermautotrophica]
MNKILPFNGKVLILIIIGLFLVDWGLNRYLDWRLLEKQDWRVNNPDLGSIRVVLDRLPRAPGLVVVCLGDSEMYGSSTPADRTIPAYLARSLREKFPGQKITVINLGIKGLKPAEAYFLVRQLKKMPVDILVYNISRGWFAEKGGVRFQDVLRLPGNAEAARNLGIKVAETSREEQLGEKVAAVWSFYRYRQVVARDFLHLSDLVQGTAERSQAPQQWQQKQQQQAGQGRPWQEKKEVLLKGAGGQLASLNLTTANLEWRLYLELLREWENAGRPALVYATPANMELLKQKYKIDVQRWEKEKQQILAAARRHNCRSLDYSQLIESNWFTDEIHLMAEGNRKVAEHLAQELASLPAARASLAGMGN